MSGSTIGKNFRVTTWGESHGKGIGAVVDGCPSGISLSEEDIQIFLDRRKPGKDRFATGRKESDTVEILSGVFEGKTTGTPISLIIKNSDQHSSDYENIKDVYRPGHADFGYDKRFGFRDYRGGGRSSGRETAGRVAAGAVAVRVLSDMGVSFVTYVNQIGPIISNPDNFDEAFILNNPLCMADRDAYERAVSYLDELREDKDSSGGCVTCIIRGVRAGIGDPVFEKLDAELAKAVFSIGAVKGFEIGEGFKAASLKGSENNDAFASDNTSEGIYTVTNHCGGILGGISTGSDIVMRAYFKPTPSIARLQQTVDREGHPVTIEIKGRHDPIIAPRAAVVVETMAAVTVLDAYLSAARIEDS